MLLNDKNTIKQGFNHLSIDPIMNFFIKNFGDEIDALDRYDDNFAIALCNLIIEQQISFKAAITIKKKFANLIKSFSNKEIILSPTTPDAPTSAKFIPLLIFNNFYYFFSNI